MDQTTTRSRLSKADWVAGATAVLAEDGLFGVSIDRLAMHLGVTKGSFYAHFESRDELITEVLDRFHSLDTDEVIARADEIADPRERLALFLEFGFERLEWGRVFAALCAACSDPRVEPAMRRITEQRMDYLEKALRAVGFDKAAARDRAILIYATYVGFWRIVTAFPDWGLNDTRRLRKLSEQVKAMLVPPA
ncbi:MAG TPA: TetR/AcrR family transcriptional regulator [Acidimicrobiia bacterium]|nr:TetR/AcrR family transcriptional regulator [Acidimicrobiia bacterium]